MSGDYAFEWGTYRGAARPLAGGRGDLQRQPLRILQRQPDGAGRCIEQLTTSDPPATQ